MSLVANPKAIRLGIIGMTEGNGHPYSWSAIFNGYDREAMTAECPFAGIPVYLNKEDPASMGIAGAKVVAVCCDRRSDAEHIARLSKIPQVVDRPEDFIGKVDAVIIATDIGHQHVERVRPFVKAGLPIFIDKPLCDKRKDLQYFRDAVASGLPLMSSSCMRYAKEFVPYHDGRTRELGDLRLVLMKMSKKWETYGIHALEAIYPIVGPGFLSISNRGDSRHNIVHMRHRRGIEIVVCNIYDMFYDPSLTLSGTLGSVTLHSADTYGTFRAQLVAFVDYLRSGKRPFDFSQTSELMQLVIGGIESREKQGAEIAITPEDPLP
ncbi:MAG: Gfo/Idh/MocA family oxidoreductase [Lentisphaeria bacterium]|jgi:predicted dehydrogenase|nr:Gfo/Idh/MocA family oxidoreductase [Lentisphaeria bacterium]